MKKLEGIDELYARFGEPLRDATPAEKEIAEALCCILGTVPECVARALAEKRHAIPLGGACAVAQSRVNGMYMMNSVTGERLTIPQAARAIAAHGKSADSVYLYWREGVEYFAIITGR